MRMAFLSGVSRRFLAERLTVGPGSALTLVISSGQASLFWAFVYASP